MSNMLAVLAGTLLSAVWLMPTALAQTACVTQYMAVPPGANTSDKALAVYDAFERGADQLLNPM